MGEGISDFEDLDFGGFRMGLWKWWDDCFLDLGG